MNNVETTTVAEKAGQATQHRADQIDAVSMNSSMAERIERQISAIDDRVQQLVEEYDQQDAGAVVAKPDSTEVWGVPFSKLTLETTLNHIDKLIASGQPGYFITANLNYNMLTDQHPELKQVNDEASFIVADGMPMIWWSKFQKDPLPERVTGSEMIYAVSKWAAIRGQSIYFLGGAEGVAQTAADVLQERYPGLKVAGVDAPPFRKLSDEEEQAIVDRIAAAKPDILYVALGQPKGEKWMYANREALGVPVCVQLGASFDFVAGCVPRSPKWIQKIGMEWAYRFWCEPKRLGPRYFGNAKFLLKAVLRDLFAKKQRS